MLRLKQRLQQRNRSEKIKVNLHRRNKRRIRKNERTKVRTLHEKVRTGKSMRVVGVVLTPSTY